MQQPPTAYGLHDTVKAELNRLVPEHPIVWEPASEADEDYLTDFPGLYGKS